MPLHRLRRGGKSRVIPPLAMIIKASQILVETKAPDPGYDTLLDTRDPLAVATSGFIAVLALYVGFRVLRENARHLA